MIKSGKEVYAERRRLEIEKRLEQERTRLRAAERARHRDEDRDEMSAVMLRVDRNLKRVASALEALVDIGAKK